MLVSGCDIGLSSGDATSELGIERLGDPCSATLITSQDTGVMFLGPEIDDNEGAGVEAPSLPLSAAGRQGIGPSASGE